jgi:hypothetical protein
MAKQPSLQTATTFSHSPCACLRTYRKDCAIPSGTRTDFLKKFLLSLGILGMLDAVYNSWCWTSQQDNPEEAVQINSKVAYSLFSVLPTSKGLSWNIATG